MAKHGTCRWIAIEIRKDTNFELIYIQLITCLGQRRECQVLVQFSSYVYVVAHICLLLHAGVIIGITTPRNTSGPDLLPVEGLWPKKCRRKVFSLKSYKLPRSLGSSPYTQVFLEHKNSKYSHLVNKLSQAAVILKDNSRG